MKVFQVILKPRTGFGTPLKGDTLFGHLCWQIYYDPKLLGFSLTELLKDYANEPFMIVSCAYPYVKDSSAKGKIFLKRPSLPIHFLYRDKLSPEELIRDRKKLKRKNWFVFDPSVRNLLAIEYLEMEFVKDDEQVRASIHRISGTTQEAPFGPYGVGKFWYLTDLVVFIALRDGLKVEGVVEALRRIGKFGFGKDASCGWGKFEVLEAKEIDFYAEVNNFNAYYTLSPALPERAYKAIYYEPFVRFGRHGDVLSVSKNPFKAPVLVADSGAIFIPEDVEKRLYIGKAVCEVSAVNSATVMQGYSIVIPVEVPHEFISPKV